MKYLFYLSIIRAYIFRIYIDTFTTIFTCGDQSEIVHQSSFDDNTQQNGVAKKKKKTSCNKLKTLRGGE